MSLDTVLKIGKTLRKSSDNLKYYKYVLPCPLGSDGNSPLCISIKVNEDFSFDFNSVSIVPENKIDSLYYLKYKTSDSDGLVKYIYGDIYYGKSFSVKKDGSIEQSENGYYRLSNPSHPNKAFQPSSFNRGDADSQSIGSIGKYLLLIRQQFKNNLEIIENMLHYSPAIEYYFKNNLCQEENFVDFISQTHKLYDLSIQQNFNKIPKQTLKKLGLTTFPNNDDNVARKKIFDLSNSQIFIHFDYNGKQWYQFEEDLNAVTTKMLEEFVDATSDKFVLKKSLYKNLCSGDPKNDIQFPGFSIGNKNKSRSFSRDELNDLFYAIDYTSKGKLILGTEIKLIVLPEGSNLTEKDYDDFLQKSNEGAIVMANEFDNSLFNFAMSDNPNITVFDLILCKKGGLTSPDSDLIELSGIEKSKLRSTRERISRIASDIYNERSQNIGTIKDLNPFSIERSFRLILGTPQFEEKTKKVKFVANPKYQSHLLKILPQIYLDNYYDDDMLLTSFISNVESSIRFGDSMYFFMKYDLKFLYSIQNNQNSKYMEITESKSYQIGLLLGQLAKNLSQEINSFEKNYVGNLTRRISSLNDFIRLKNDIEQKLVMHDKTKFTYNISYELAQKVKGFDAKYDKEECAFGFMESYFMPIKKTENNNDSINN